MELQNRHQVQDKPILRKRFSNQVPSKFRKARDKKVPTPKVSTGKIGSFPIEKPTCAKCGKIHLGECLVGMGIFFYCGKNGQKVRDCPNAKGQEKGG